LNQEEPPKNNVTYNNDSVHILKQTGLYTQGIVNDNGEMAECNDQ